MSTFAPNRQHAYSNPGLSGTQSALGRRNAHGALPTRFDSRIHHLPLLRFTWMWIVLNHRTLPVTACRTLRCGPRRGLGVVHDQRRWWNRHCTHSDKSRVLVEHSSIASVGEAESARHSAGFCRDHIYRRGKPLDVSAFVGGRRQRSARADFAGSGDLHMESVAAKFSIARRRRAQAVLTTDSSARNCPRLPHGSSHSGARQAPLKLVRFPAITGASERESQVSRAAIEVAQRDAPPAPASVPPAPVPPAPAPRPPAPPAPEPPAPEPAPPPPPPPCSFTLAPDVCNAPASGGSTSVSVNSPAGCAWTVTGAVSWVTVSPLSGSGSATLKIAAAANSGNARTAALSVGGRELRVEQAQLPACTYAVTPESFTVSHKKQQKKVEVATLSHCQWTATSSVPWVRVSSGARTGSGEIELKVDDYSRSETRSAVVTIAGQNFSSEVTVTQIGED